MRLFIVALALFLASAVSVTAASPGFEWKHYEEQDAGRLYLFQNGVQIGAWDWSKQYYRPYNAATDTWGETCDPPLAVPFGVTWEGCTEETCTFNGKRITKAEATRIIKEGIPDDAHLRRMTIIGTQEQCLQVVQDLQKPPLQEFAGTYLLQCYPPDHWAVARCGFHTVGSPVIYIQTPDGKVLHRQDSYAGPENLATALRKANPAYEPVKDPNVTQPIKLPDLPPWAWALGLGSAFYLYTRKDQ